MTHTYTTEGVHALLRRFAAGTAVVPGAYATVLRVDMLPFQGRPSSVTIRRKRARTPDGGWLFEVEFGGEYDSEVLDGITEYTGEVIAYQRSAVRDRSKDCEVRGNP